MTLTLTKKEPTKLHTMQIVDYDRGTKVVNWNGDVADREAAKRVFDELMQTNGYLAYATVTEAPEATSGGTKTDKPRKEQISQFNPEAEHTWVVPRVVGG